MSAFFDIADEMTRQGFDTPEEWEYRPGLSAGEWPNADECSFFRQVIIDRSESDLVNFGNILARYTRALRSAGRDY